MSSSDVFWLTMLVVGLGYELYAIFNERSRDTLSEKVWALLFIDGRPDRSSLRAFWRSMRKPQWFVLAGFMFWLTPHFLFRILGG